MPYVLAIDQGTTSTRAVVFDHTGRGVGTAAAELTQHFPRPGWVEHDAEEIWGTVTHVVPEALRAAGVKGSQLAAVGVTNQRETVVLWERGTNRPLARAIVWQDRRTADFCRQHIQDEPWITERTGLVLDPYFSATKLRWLLDQEGRQVRAERGELAAGTIDSWLIWRLTGGRSHVTDVSNASRTLLLNIGSAAWDDDLCRYFGVPRTLLPEVRASAGDFGVTAGLSFLPDGLPLTGVAGDQQAALFGQGGFNRGAAKCTYGTGAFFLQHTGDQRVHSRHRLLSSLAAMPDERRQYVIEGSVFVAGAAVQWLRDGLKLFATSAEVEKFAAASDADQPILFLPAFVGLGAPYWVPEARAVVFGLTRNTTREDLSRAALEGVAYQVADLLDAAAKDTGESLPGLRVDGGMARNAWFLQAQADILGMPVLQAPESEATALGAAFLAGLRVGVWPDLDALRSLLAEPRRFEPRLADGERRRRRQRWQQAVQAVIGFYSTS
jgi:glycerol kinase